MNTNTYKKVKRPLKAKITLAIAVIICTIDIVCIAINYTNYMNVNRDYTDSLAETVANTAVLVINGDRITEYLDTKRRDTEYYEVWNKLIDYKNTNQDIIGLNIVYFDEAGGHYVLDTDLSKEGAFLGDVRPFDIRQEDVKERLINCAEIDTLNYGGRLDYYIPIYSSYNIPVAYIIVGISIESIQATQYLYLGYITLIVSGITFAFGIFLIWFMNRNVIAPINALSDAASNYSVEMLSGNEESPISRMNIATGDELERLCESMKKMEYDIIFSTSQLAVADWNSNHDSMTQLYNKRHYENVMKDMEKRKDVGVIYLDIDNLKKMNDTFGHEKGDEVIIKAAGFIRKYTQPGFSCCRIGGDEFVMLIPGCSEATLNELIRVMREDKDGILSDPKEAFYCRLAIGGAFRTEGESFADTVKRADDEMYQNKHSVR